MYDCEYVVVGSGAGGGTIAARLAESGKTVVLLEAGGDPKELSGGDRLQPSVDRLPCDYDVPAFHAFASENDAMTWDFYVRHYADEERSHRDTKFVSEVDGKKVDGILYPRAGTLGGCTAHNAMIFVYPNDDDWNDIARLTGDATWTATAMRSHARRLEKCRHRPLSRWLAKFGIDPTRHGWDGWLDTEAAFPGSVLEDKTLIWTILRSAFEAARADGRYWQRLRWLFQGGFDPNDGRLLQDNAVGIRYTPLTTRNHERVGTRERVLDVARRHPGNLKIVLNALVTRILFDQQNRAIGVEYRKGERLYRAHTKPSDADGSVETISASREVIIAGGTFNTPQLLMLSGIGPREHLESHGIGVRVDLPGVGANLQDRYEIGVVNRMAKPWKAYEGATFTTSDRQFAAWRTRRTGVYTSNGSVLTTFRSSPNAKGAPDLFCMMLLARFSGYFPTYSSKLVESKDHLTWVVLKAHTRNRAGNIRLRSADPRDMPLVNFAYFTDAGSDEDLDAVVDGVRYVRRLAAPLKRDGVIAEEEVPGESVQSDDELRAFVRANAWGHHACGTCAIGPRESSGVLTSDFRVHGVQNVRVVDASVFPRIPGVFLASAVYLIGEKAADDILNGSSRS